MLFIGIISLVQLIFLPGYIFNNIVNLKYPTNIQYGIYTFSLSLIINYLIVYFLILLNCYKVTIIYLFILFEFIIIILILKKKNINIKEKIIIKNYIKVFLDILDRNKPYKNVVYCTTFLIMLLYIIFFIRNIGTVFNGWDSVVSWNRWAIDLYNNEFPKQTWHYPQLITANWSLTYMIIQTSDVQMFAKFIMPLFPISIMCLYIDSYMIRKEISYLLSAIIYGGMLLFFYSPSAICDGYIDIAVSFFGFITIFYLANNLRDAEVKLKEIMMITILASSAIVVKQAAIYILIFVLIYIIRYLIINRVNKNIFIKAIVIIFIITFIFSSYYLIVEYRIIHGYNSSEITYVTQKIYGDTSYIMRIKNALRLLVIGINAKGIFIIPFLFIMTLLSLREKKSRFLLIFILLPYSLMWTIFYSYDFRNLNLTFPLYSYCAAVGLDYSLSKILLNFNNKNKRYNLIKSLDIFLLIILISGFLIHNIYFIQNLIVHIISKIKHKPIKLEWYEKVNNIGFHFIKFGIYLIIAWCIIRLIKRIKFKKEYITIKLIYVVISIVITVFGLNLLFSKNYIVNNQINLQKTACFSDTNLKLYNYYYAYGLKGKILTNYQVLGFLPEIKQYYYCFSNYNNLFELTQNKDVKYLLLMMWNRNNSNNHIFDEIDDKIKRGELKVIFDSKENCKFVEIIK